MLRIISSAEFRQQQDGSRLCREMLHSLKSIRYCKAEAEGNALAGIMRIPRKSTERTPLACFGFYMTKKELVLISDEPAFGSHVAKHRQRIDSARSPEELLLLLFAGSIADDVLFLSHIDMAMDEMEEKLLAGKDRDFLHELTKFRRKLSELNAFYVQLGEMADDFQAQAGAQADEQVGAQAGKQAGDELISDRLAWQTMAERLERLQSYVSLLHEYALQLTELYQSEQAAKQNRVISILTVVTTIFLPLTLLTGWYGMNFAAMPELDWKYGYLCAIGAAVLIVVGEIIYFKKKKML